jgi:hypothetical protein
MPPESLKLLEDVRAAAAYVVEKTRGDRGQTYEMLPLAAEQLIVLHTALVRT